jgi:hypothetical protein
MLYLLGRKKESPVTPTKPTPNKKAENNNKRVKIDTPGKLISPLPFCLVEGVEDVGR